MNSFKIPAGKNTPEVNYAKGKLHITGRSYPEDAMGFFTKVTEHLSKITAPETLCFHLDFEYVNSSSIACILDIIKDQQRRLPKTGFSIELVCDSNDDDMKSVGENYESISGIPVTFILK